MKKATSAIIQKQCFSRKLTFTEKMLRLKKNIIY